MDPKQQLSSLDPKLKEAYERVMASGKTPAPSPYAVGQPPPQPMNPTIGPQMPVSPLNPVGTQQPNSSPNPTVGITPPSQPMTPIMPTINSTSQPAQNATQAPTMQVTPPIPPVSQPAQTGPVKVQFNTQIGPATQPGQNPGMQKKKGGGKIPPALIVVAGVVFLLAYAIFWMKVFNIPIPFLG